MKISKVVLKFTYVMNHIENCVENHVKFQGMLKTMSKFQSMPKITVM